MERPQPQRNNRRSKRYDANWRLKMVFELCEIDTSIFWRNFRLAEKALHADRFQRFVKQIEKINGFRNTYVAHQEQPLEDVEQARVALKEWAAGLYDIW